MVLFNNSRQQIITSDLQIAGSFFQKGLGLLNPNNSRALLFKTRFGIHTLGLKQPIDVLVLDNHLKVVTMKHSLKPTRFFFWNPIHSTVIELPKGSLLKSGTRIGDSVSIN